MTRLWHGVWYNPYAWQESILKNLLVSTGRGSKWVRARCSKGASDVRGLVAGGEGEKMKKEKAKNSK